DYMSKDMGQIAAAIGAQTKIPQQTRELLLAFIKESSDLAHFRANLEGWFDRVMDRASGWYKRRIANVVLVLSALVVAGANIDSIAICQALYGDPQLRAAMLAQAAQSLKEGAPSAPPQDADVRLGQYQADLEKLRSGGLPLGWQSVTRPKGDNLAWYASKVAGLLITILAASLGAPFWFDMLSKVANIRGAGPKPG
ncbi:MAG: hypothetical protein JO370_02335, partial [Paucibacter sp.]|nr:hypothetical protein [Roseateles sp.]